MLKRCNHDEDIHHPARKRIHMARVEKTDLISTLSDELLLQILSFLPTTTLLLCQRLSRRFYALAGDSELWKRQYYSQWVWPRTRRTTNRRCAGLSSSNFNYTPKVSTWLDHGHLARGSAVTNWKRQYRLQHNWSRGICRVVEIEFPQPLRPPMLVDFCAGFVFVVDLDYTLRIWEAGNPQSCLARVPGADFPDVPTALAVGRHLQQNMIEITVGFESGRFSLWNLDVKTLRLSLRFTHPGAADGAITTIALSLPYALMISQHKTLSLYKVPPEGDKPGQPLKKEDHLLASLKADSIFSPASLSIRIVGSQVIASIVYSFFHLGCGWSLGIQELHFNRRGQQRNSRLATTVESQHETMPPYSAHAEGLSTLTHETRRGQRWARPSEPSILHRDPPTSVSYSHPYLLTSHADNTLTMYLVVSTAASLSVKGGRRLWGHTSSVSAVQVSNRGKAVSISSRGGEVRIWELEAIVSSSGTHRALREDISIQASPENKNIQEHSCDELRSHDNIFQASRAMASSAGRTASESAQIRSCVGFDEERVLLLREMDLGGQLLEVYDFT
ncbi:F-box domain protein [Aspergillus steynii IBT 23096]|uniref:Probable E3 ubiquitin ligase complex SCF subunit sconB n=1 Tax=Aspergillus steynii IBT 23096 TaxID=1392250 RepID=A0A2I2FXK7_9EURO|nr:F-box domain protein [Aspergillus steynii IBT 23096]PLB45357.1 F-box domain protein [Aspergillus steynii IBT 23096]